MNRPPSNKVRLPPHVTVGEVVGSPVDARARRRRGRGGVRHVRWCIDVLREYADDTPVLAVDYEYAEQLEDYLIDHVGVAPSSARKVIQHLLALRRSVAGRLHFHQLPAGGIDWGRLPLDPGTTIQGYAAFRPALQPRSRVAADLVTACRLKPATVLRLRGADVGPGGRKLRVRGQSKSTVLPVPQFLWDDLAGLAAAAGRSGCLFPGRSKGGSLSPATLRNHVQAASRDALGAETCLRDLGRLGASILGPGSSNPAGRVAALRRIAAIWRSIDDPPIVDCTSPEETAGDAARHELDDLGGAFDALQEQVDELQRQVSSREGLINSAYYLSQQANRRAKGLDRDLTAHSRDQVAHRSPPVAPQLRETLDEHGKRLRRLERRPTALVRQGPTVAQVDENRARLDRMESQLRQTRNAVAAQVMWLVGRELAEAGIFQPDVLERIGRALAELGDAAADDRVPRGPDGDDVVTRNRPSSPWTWGD